MRLSWERYALKLAETAALRSEDSHRTVGACALNRDKMVLGLGYNGLAAGKEAPPLFWEDRDSRRKYMIHAEANCLSLFQKNEAELLAVTHMPCSHCATMIAAYKIPRVVYSHVYEKDLNAIEIFKFYGIKLDQISF